MTRTSGATRAFRTSRPIAILLLSLSMAMVAFAMASLVLPGGDALPDRPDLLTVVVVAFVMLSYPFVGAILAIRRPGNPLGWLLLVLGLGFTIAFFSTDYVGRAVVSGWSLPGVVLVAWISNWGFAVDMAIGFTWIPLLFPTGHLPGPRWRLVAWAIVITMFLGITANALRPGPLDSGLGTLPNPFGIDALAGILALVETLYFPAIAALGVICVGSLFVRFRRSGAVERQQVKWFLLANAAFLVTLVVAFATFNDAAFVLALVAAAGIPIAAGIAILRYRLWDIDRIVSRTVSWAVITAVLVAVFVGGVLGLQAVLAGGHGGANTRRRGLHAAGLRAVPATAPARPARRRPALRSRSHRCGAHRTGLRRTPPGRGRDRCDRRRPADDHRQLGAAVTPGPVAAGSGGRSGGPGLVTVPGRRSPIMPVMTAPSRRRGLSGQARLAWLLAVACLATFSFLIVLSPQGDLLDGVLFAVPMATLLIVGAVLVTRVPGNAIGSWLLVAGVSFSATMFALAASTALAIAEPPPWPVVAGLALLGQLLESVPIAIAVIVVPLHFPDGRLPSPRWRWILWLAAIAFTANAIGVLFGPVANGPPAVGTVANPLSAPVLARLLDALGALPLVTAVPAFLGAAASVVVRYRRAGRVERQQLKWLLAVASVAAIAFLASFAVADEAASTFLYTLGYAAIAALPVAIGIAIMRYRLYDIDRIISRTVSWTVVSATLVAVFIAGVLAMQAILSDVMQAQTLAVAASTLLAAALFQPLRLLVQRAVDRRFDRAAVDADRATVAFAARLRDEVDLETVTQDLVGTVDEVVRPESARVWLRQAGAGSTP